MIHIPHAASVVAMLGIVCLGQGGCRPSQPPARSSVEFTRLPPAGEGSPDILLPIEGRVTGAQPGQRIVLLAQSGLWWVQPLSNHPFTPIQPDSRWKNSTHPGSAYAALLVDAGYTPPATMNALPQPGGVIRAVATADGAMLDRVKPKVVDFSGYEWDVRQTPGTPGGSRNLYDPENVTVDKDGFLHLRIAKKGAAWTSSEVDMPRSLGYGSYRFVVRNVAHLEPAAVLAMTTWDDAGPYREIDIEIGRWGESSGKNAQYVIQPYYIPANVVRFLAPPGRLAYSFVWEPGKVSFQTARDAHPIAAHVFTSGIPSPGSESVRLNLYVFANQRNPLRHEVEVIIEKFEYLP